MAADPEWSICELAACSRSFLNLVFSLVVQLSCARLSATLPSTRRVVSRRLLLELYLIVYLTTLDFYSCLKILHVDLFEISYSDSLVLLLPVMDCER